MLDARMTIKRFPAYLRDMQEDIEGHAKHYGLDFFPILYEVLDYKTMNEVAAYGGFPTRYPHWRFGMDYEQLSKSYEWGLSKIYEMVINTNPAYAYLLEGNSLTDQKIVMAHVCAHVDFFKNNYFFSKTNRKMIDGMANHASRVRRHMGRHGQEAVEDFIDTCLSLENLIDPMSAYIVRQRDKVEADDGDEQDKSGRLRAKGYMESFINPPEYLAAQKKKREDEEKKAKRRFPESPQRDVLAFLIQHAPLEHWQRDCLEIVRDEAYYFAPQAMTKVMNEGWACIAINSIVYTENGLLTMGQLVDEEAGFVFDGVRQQRVYDRNIIHDHPTVTMTTRRGLTLTGSNNHRVQLADRVTWKRLDELAVGDAIALCGGGDLWPSEQVPVHWTEPYRVTLSDVAAPARVSIDRVRRSRPGAVSAATAEAVQTALVEYERADNLALPVSTNRRATIRIPARVDAKVAAFLGYLVGDGHISRVKRVLGLTTGDESQASAFHRLAQDLFGVTASIALDDGRWRVLLHSEHLADLLVECFGMTHGPSAREKRIPEQILRSPEPVVRAFLRAYFDCDGYAGDQGVILSTTSDKLAEQTQLLLLNYRILSRKRRQADGCWHVHVAGASEKRFAERIGFGLERKQRRLDDYVASRQWFNAESWDDEVVALEAGRADVYDISVTETHRYAAGGFINHNSYWHSKILTEKALTAAEIIDYADANSGVLATSPGKLNPYKLGVELFRNIEDRWNKGQFGKEWDECDQMDLKRNWDRRTGLGAKRIFEVRKLYNDITFLDEFFTLEFCIEQKFYAFGFSERSGNWEIMSREFKKVKDQLLKMLTNRGQPVIVVEDGNFENKSELLLRHVHEGTDLDGAQARDTLRNASKVWTRPVSLLTKIEGKGKLLRCEDGNLSERSAEYQ
jgi:stage V sporulation protein R